VATAMSGFWEQLTVCLTASFWIIQIIWPCPGTALPGSGEYHYFPVPHPSRSVLQLTLSV